MRRRVRLENFVDKIFKNGRLILQPQLRLSATVQLCITFTTDNTIKKLNLKEVANSTVLIFNVIIFLVIKKIGRLSKVFECLGLRFYPERVQLRIIFLRKCDST